MIPAGYLTKRIVSWPEWLEAAHVRDVYSLSTHISPAFADYIDYWQHNGYWLFDSPELIKRIALEHAIDPAGLTVFFYEVYELQFDQDKGRWLPWEPAPFVTNVVVPSTKQLAGYDVVTFSAGSGPECSPLSCNRLANSIATNEHCLLASFEEAQHLLDTGAFKHSEPGPFRIFAVYSITEQASELT